MKRASRAKQQRETIRIRFEKAVSSDSDSSDSSSDSDRSVGAASQGVGGDSLRESVVLWTTTARPPVARELSRLDIDEYVGTVRSMQATIRALVGKVAALETELAEVKKKVAVRRRAVPAQQWLQENVRPERAFIDHILEYDAGGCTVDDMLYVCSNSACGRTVTKSGPTASGVAKSGSTASGIATKRHAAGLFHVFSRIFPLEELERHPVRSFSHKRGVVFVYTREKRWAPLTTDEMTRVVRILFRALTDVLLEWQERNREKIEAEDRFRELSMQYQAHLTCRASDEAIGAALKKQIYAYVRRNLRDVIKYEYT